MGQRVFGIDIDRFPRGLPDSAVLYDTFPLQPIPEAMQPALNDLLGELALASALISGRRTACILAGSEEGYGGHVIERGYGDVSTAAGMALAKVPSPDTNIYGMMVTGEGQMKEKHVMPSGGDYDKIAKLLVPDSPIVVVTPNNYETCRIIPAAMHEVAYAPKPIFVFRGQTLFQSKLEAIRNTMLSIEDCEFVAQLRMAGLNDSTQYYLTGSASTLTAQSFAIKYGRYADLDIIAVTDQDTDTAQAAFESVAEARYGRLEKQTEFVRTVYSDRATQKAVYQNHTGIAIDFVVTPRLADVLRPDDLDRNNYHKLS